MNFTKILRDTLGIDLAIYRDFKIESACGLILLQGRLHNGATITTRYLTKPSGIIERYDSHKRFAIETRNDYIRLLRAADVDINTIALMMDLSSAMIRTVLKGAKNE